MTALDPTLVEHAHRQAEAKWGKPMAVSAGTVVVPEGPRTWYILIAASGGDRKAREALEARGISVYVPRRIEIIRHHRSKKLMRRSFPLLQRRYMFAEMPVDLGQWWAIVHSIEHLKGALGEAGQPRALAAAVIADIMHREAAGAFDNGGKKKDWRRQFSANRFPPGSTARALGGPFSGFAGRVESIDGRGAIKVLISIFGRATPVDFDAEWLEPA